MELGTFPAWHRAPGSGLSHCGGAGRAGSEGQQRFVPGLSILAAKENGINREEKEEATARDLPRAQGLPGHGLRHFHTCAW